METQSTIQQRGINGWMVIAVLICLLFLLMIVNTSYCTYVVPKWVPALKAQGATELPVFWEFAVDLSEFSMHEGFVMFPMLLVGAGFAIYRAFPKKQHGV